MTHRAAFTLFELLMVLGLLALLASLSVPALRSWQKRIDVDRASSEILEMISEAKLRAAREGSNWNVHWDEMHSRVRLEQPLNPPKGIALAKLPSHDFRILPSSIQVEISRESGEKLTFISVNTLGHPTPALIWLSQNGQRVQGYEIDRLTGEVHRLARRHVRFGNKALPEQRNRHEPKQ